MNRVSKILGTKYPIVQAPLSWVTSAELVAAVSNAGGLGVLGPNAGQNSQTSSAKETGERLRQEIAKTRQLTDKPFGVNSNLFEKMDEFDRAILDVLIDEKVKIVVAVGDAVPDRIKSLKEKDFTVIFRELTPTVRGAKIAENAGADIIGATGFDAGGFVPKHPIGTMTIVRLLVENVNVPVLAVGGIVDRKTVNAAFALGSEGVYIGTRFIASVESPVAEITKQNIVKFGTDDLLLYRTAYSFNRATPNKLAKKLKQMELSGATGEEIDQQMYGNGGLMTGMLNGDTDLGIDSYSSSLGLIKDIKTCREIIEDLIKDVQL